MSTYEQQHAQAIYQLKAAIHQVIVVTDESLP